MKLGYYWLTVLGLLAAVPAWGQDAALVNEVRNLQTLVIQLSNKVTNLENKVSALEKRNAVVKKNTPTGTLAQPAASRQGWHSASNWGRLVEGMSEGRVRQILGPPTKRKVNSIDYVTLTYSGVLPNGIHATGNVELNNDDQIRYSGVKSPSFR